MRLVQRIGRLYRYGQGKRVVVFNVHAPQTLDAEIMEIMYTRITQVASDMAVLGDEYNENLAEDILGELADMLEVEEIIEEAIGTGTTRTRERIEEALARARSAVEKQRELFEHVTGYDPDGAKRELAITGAHVRASVEGMFMQLGIEIVEMHHSGLVWDIRLPESVAAEMSSRRTRWRITLDRTWGTTRSDIHMLDLESPLMRLILRRAKAYEFGGRTAGVVELPGAALVAAVLRWQNEQGRRMRQEFAMVSIFEGTAAEMNPKELADWLTAPAEDGAGLHAASDTERWLHTAQQAMERRLADMSNADLHPENRAVDCGCVAGRMDRMKRSGQLSASGPLAGRLSSDASEGFAHATIVVACMSGHWSNDGWDTSLRWMCPEISISHGYKRRTSPGDRLKP